MYLDIEVSFNSFLIRGTYTKVDMKLSLSALIFAVYFARLASKKGTSCFALARASFVLLEVKYTPHPFDLEKVLTSVTI